ncbi:MAG: hypothetical protein IPJ77_18150 [Planctomycetes bacterium]|nr:hypothetical protein [Planctomycetota bacterium]
MSLVESANAKTSEKERRPPLCRRFVSPHARTASGSVPACAARSTKKRST